MANEIIKKYGIAILITIGIAIIGISSTYAYFAISMNGETDGGPDFVASATTSSSNITLNTIRSINATDRKPGYNDVMAFSVISASNTTFDVNMVANSTIETPISYTVYKTTSQVNVSNSCENVSDTINSQYSENCSITNIGSLGDSIASGTITNNTSNYVLLSNQEASSTIVYYYVVFTYPNANASQDSDFFKSLNVSIEIEEKDTSLENSYVNYSLTYTGLPESYSSAHNIVNQSVKKGTSVTVTDADVEGYRLNEIIITGNDTTTIPVKGGYNLSNIDIVLDVNTEIEMRYVTGNSTASTNTSETPKVSSEGTSEGTTIVTPVSTSSTTVYDTLSQTLNTNNITSDDRYDFEMNTTSHGPVTLTFDVSSKASEGDTVTLMHYKESTHKWENLGSKTVDDTLTATWVLTSFSPFSLVITNRDIWFNGSLAKKILEDNNATSLENVPMRSEFSESYSCRYRGEVVYETADSNLNLEQLTIPDKSNCSNSSLCLVSPFNSVTSPLITDQETCSLIANIDMACYYPTGEKVIDFATVNMETYEYQYATESTCASTPVCYASGVGPVTNISEEMCTNVGLQMGIPTTYYNDLYGTWEGKYATTYTNERAFITGAKTGCHYNNLSVIDAETIDFHRASYSYANESTCRLTPICMAEGYGPVTNVSPEMCIALGSQAGIKTEYLNEYASWQEYSPSYDTFFRTNNAENGETVYYFAGDNSNVNNWVIFGTCKNSDWNCNVGDDLYWRIIRTNERATGGGIRLLYAGSGSQSLNNNAIIANNVNNAYIALSPFNEVSDSFLGFGYMYGIGKWDTSMRNNTSSSTIKTLIDNWYEDTFDGSDLSSRIDNRSVYCNDRSWSLNSPNNPKFGSEIRNGSNDNEIFSPSYACGVTTSGFGSYISGGNNRSIYGTDNFADKFSSKKTNYGNGYLKYPVALITYDEIVFSDDNIVGIDWYKANREGNSITGDKSWWTLSPSIANYSSSNQSINYRMGDGSYSTSTASNAVRPVLSLHPVTFWLSGDGTPNNPYRIY